MREKKVKYQRVNLILSRNPTGLCIIQPLYRLLFKHPEYIKTNVRLAIINSVADYITEKGLS